MREALLVIAVFPKKNRVPFAAEDRGLGVAPARHEELWFRCVLRRR